MLRDEGKAAPKLVLLRYAKGSEIDGLADAAKVEGVEIFHAGTVRDGGRILANGGRVLNVSALGATVAEAQARMIRDAPKIDYAQRPGDQISPLSLEIH